MEPTTFIFTLSKKEPAIIGPGTYVRLSPNTERMLKPKFKRMYMLARLRKRIFEPRFVVTHRNNSTHSTDLHLKPAHIMSLPRRAYAGSIFEGVTVNVYDVRTKIIVFTGFQNEAAAYLGIQQGHLYQSLKQKSVIKKQYAVRIAKNPTT